MRDSVKAARLVRRLLDKAGSLLQFQLAMHKKSKVFFIAFMVLLASASLYTACGKLWQKPNVVVLLVDTLRADHLECYGYHRNTAPVLNELAQQGAIFTQCYAPSDYTPASTASLFTGKYPLAHGYLNSHYVLEESHTTLAEIFKREGYTTAGFIANGLAGKKYHMDQGFDHYFEKNRAPATELAAAAAAFIEAQADEPFFMYMHFLDVHDPYRIPAQYHSKFADPATFVHAMQDTLQLEQFVMSAWWDVVQRWKDPNLGREQIEAYFSDYTQLYDASISYWDESLGTLLASLRAQGIDQNTIIVVTSDHGEQFLEHGYFGHGNSGYQVGLHIPFILYDPLSRQIAGLQMGDLVNAIDILPTLLARLGVEIPAAVQGQERWSLLESGGQSGATLGTTGEIYTEGTFMSNRPFSTLIQTYRQGEWKLLLDRLRDTKELYHIGEDPGERRDRFAAEPETAARLYGKMRAYYNKNLKLFRQQQQSEMQLEEQKLRELRSLGYITGQRGLQRPRAEFFPMKSVRLEQFGPFGDEEDLHRFAAAIDFSGGQVAWGQVIGGYSDTAGRRDAAGVWFDRRATFLMPNQPASKRVVVEVVIDAVGGADNPTRLELEFNNRSGTALELDGPGAYRLEADFPAFLQQSDYFYLTVQANNRFVIRKAASVRNDIYGSMRIRRVYLEK